MSRQHLGAPGYPLQKARTTNSTDSAFTAPVATTTMPTGGGVVDMRRDPPTWVRVVPFGVGADNTTFDVRVLAWTEDLGFWLPTIIAQFSCTLSAFVGVAGATVDETHRFADTLSTPATNLGPECVTFSPQNDTPGWYLIHAAGAQLIEVQFDMTGATSGNALVNAADAPSSVNAITLTVDTEFPAAATLADTTSNPSTTGAAAYLFSYNGLTWDRVRLPNTLKDLATVTITTIQTAWTPASGKKVRLMGGTLSASAAMSILFEDNAASSSVKFRTPKLAADTPYTFDIPGGMLLSTINNVLKITGSAAGAVTGTIWGTEE